MLRVIREVRSRGLDELRFMSAQLASDLRLKFGSSTLGGIWVVINPILQLLIYGFLYTVILRVRVGQLEPIEYSRFLFAGLVPVLNFVDAISQSVGVFSANRSLVLSSSIPVFRLPLSSSLFAAVSSSSGFAAIILLAFISTPSSIIHLPAILCCWLLFQIFVVGVATVFSVVNIAVRDLQFVLPQLLTILVLISPFAYTPDMVPSSLRPLIALNPLVPFIQIFQSLLSNGSLPTISLALKAIFLASTSMTLGLVLVFRARRLIWDHI
jgi:lipopolysaccharide transport system permease protein